MDIVMPVSYLRGNKNNVEAGAELPDGLGRVDLKMGHNSPVLYNC